MSQFDIVREKLDQAVEVLQEKKVDLWLTFVRETTQVADPCLDLVVGFDLTWRSALIVTRDGERIAIVGRYDAENIKNIGGYTTIVGYDRTIRNPLLEHLARINPRKIALNFSEDDPAADGLTHGMFRLLAKIIGGTEYASRLVSAEEIIAALRGRKSPTEIERIREAIRTTEELFSHIGKMILPGVRERDIARWLHEAVSQEQLGLAWEENFCPIVTIGPDSSFGHVMPADFAVQPGYLVQVDFGVRQEGFVSDLQRTWYILRPGEKEPPDEVQRAWEAARAALEAGRAALRPGAHGWEVDQAARETLTQAGYPEYMHAFGHHIGRSVHDGATILGPHWERYGKAVDGLIEAGNVFAIELGVGVEGYGYIGCEEDVLVTEEGAHYLSHPQTELWCIEP